MRLTLASLSDTEMKELAEMLGRRGYPGGPPELAAEARGWIAGRQWADLEPGDVADLSDTQALSGIDRKYDGGLEAFIANCGYPPGSRF